METKNKYVVIGNGEEGEWEESLQKSLGVCKNAKKAYEIALFLGQISKPDLGYRKVLEALNKKGAVTVKQEDGEQAATIVKVREY
jgi:hypothetical protein